MRIVKKARPGHATVVAYVALFVALGGTAFAAHLIGSRDIANDAIKSRHIAAGAVRSSNVKDGSLTGFDVADGSLAGSDINQSTLQLGGTLTSRFYVPSNSFDLPTAYGPVSGMDSANATGTESDATLLSPDHALVARDMVVEIADVSGGSARRVLLRVNGSDTALSCTAQGLATNAICSPPAGTTVPVPASSMISWKTDNGGAAFNTGATTIWASMRLTEG